MAISVAVFVGAAADMLVHSLYFAFLVQKYKY
jgi:hypothetical protein